jgi:hypothetical protein
LLRNDVHQPVHDGGDRDEDLIVVILADGVYSFFLKNADNLEGYIIDPDCFADDRAVLEQVADHGSAEHSDPHGSLHFILGKKTAHAGPEIPYVGKFGSGARNHRVGARLAVFDQILPALERNLRRQLPMIRT